MILKNLKFEINNHKALLIINRPEKLNALNISTLQEIELCFNEIYQNSNIFGVIISGAGDKSFVAGADIKEFSNFTPDEGYDMVTYGQKILKLIEDCPKVVLAAVNGYAFGGGCELAMACHLRIASERATFALPEINLGILPAYGGTQRILRLIGRTRATLFLLTGEPIKSDEALEIGLVNKVVKDNELLDYSIDLINKIIKKPHNSIRAILKAINDFYENTIGFETEKLEFKECLFNNNFKEGVNAFIEKREPKFNI